MERLLLNSADELTDGQYVQKPEEILTHLDRFPELSQVDGHLLGQYREGAWIVLWSALISYISRYFYL